MGRSIRSNEGQTDSGCFSVFSSCFKANPRDRSPDADIPARKTRPQPHNALATTPAKTSSSLENGDPTQTPNALEATSNNSSAIHETPLAETHGNDLWLEAFGIIEQEKNLMREYFSDGRSSDDQDPVGGLIRDVKAQESAFKEDIRLKIKIGEREIIWRDYASKVIQGLTVLGDTAIQFAPAPSSIIWSGLKVLLKAHVKEFEALAAVLGCAAKVLPLVRCGAVYERVYLQDVSVELREPLLTLRESLVNMYAKILQLLARAKQDLDKSTAKRFMEALLDGGKGEWRRACQAAQVKEMSSENRKLLEDLQKPLRRIDDGVSAILEKMSARERKRILNKFSTVPIGDQHQRRANSRTEGTGTWLLQHQEFLDWETSSSSSILWLNGKMGAGKSVLASLVVDRYRVDNTVVSEIDEGFAFFYYSKNDQELKGDPIVHIVGSLLKQLARVPRYPDQIHTGLVELYNQMDDKEKLPDIERWKKLLLEIVTVLPRTIIVLDGLDEFEKEADARHIIGFFGQLVENSDRPVKIFLSSRDESYIRNKMLELEQNLKHITISHENQADIEEYLRVRVPEIGWRWDAEVKEEIKHTLYERSNGMFRWVYLQLEQLATIKTPFEVRNRLKTLPLGLEEAYDELFSLNKGTEQIILERAVKWVMHARLRMSTYMLAPAVQVGLEYKDGEYQLEILPQPTESALREICRHLIVEVESGDGGEVKRYFWQFPHASVEEYFRSDKHKSWAVEGAQIESVRVLLALMNNNFQVLADPWDIEKVYSEKRRDLYAAALFRWYGYCYWPYYVQSIRFKGQDTITSQLLKRFMIAEDDTQSSTLAYQKWVNHRKIADRGEHFPYWLDDIFPYENPALGITIRGLDIVAGQWAEDCLKFHLDSLNTNNLDLLCLAAKNGHTELCRKLVSWGSDVNRILPGGTCALLECIKNRQEDSFRTLVDLGVDVSPKTKSSPLCVAIEDHYTDGFKLLMSYHSDVNAVCSPSCDAGSALEAAVDRYNTDVMELLIQAGAEVDLRSNSSFGAPLVAATAKGLVDVIELLVGHGADVDIHLDTGKYAGVLAAAFCDGGLEVLRYLVETARADPHRMVPDLIERKPLVCKFPLQRRQMRNCARYLYDGSHVTVEELRSLERSSEDELFDGGFVDSISDWIDWEGELFSEDLSKAFDR
ncbi:hypothetical protein F4808DRAFT_468565 [Astrocystis sublimbata]|nr:hypothetical protein F4808DRAFT_468565 [Astrocystis sublimbata]